MIPPEELAVYLVTDTRLCAGRGVAATVREAVRGGVTLVQLRDHQAGTRRLCELARSVQPVLAGTRVRLVIDDRVDVALAVGADGVHLGQGDLPPQDARRLLGPHAVIGHSVSRPEQAAAAARLVDAAVDYLGVGPLRATPTKPDAAAPLGITGVTRVLAATDLPCVVIGGVHSADVAGLRRTGAAGVAVVSAICAADNPRAAAAALVAAGRHA